MTWDFAEANPFSSSGGNFAGIIISVAKVVEGLVTAARPSTVSNKDAITSVNGVDRPVICTDPPYYDNIGYADLSDYFYIWLRRSLGRAYPALFAGILTPKEHELVATPYRFGGDREKAEQFFEEGLGKVFANMHRAHHADSPLTLFYAFKQSEEDDQPGTEVKRGYDNGEHARDRRASTGWETMLEGLIRADFTITGTWPMRTERGARTISLGTNALGSSIVLVCRPRPADAPSATRRDFLAALKRELPDALRKLQHGNIAPVDLAQAAIGPGMAVYSRHRAVLEPDGSPMSVRTALQLINHALDEILSEQDSDYDPHTRWALAWFEQHGLDEGPFGQADVLARAKDCALAGLVDAHVLSSKAGKVRLLRRDELNANWAPPANRRPYVWEVTQHLIRALEQLGEDGAAAILRQLGGLGDTARELAYRLYNTCERKKWAEEARAYNSLVIAWPHVAQRAAQQPSSAPRQRTMYD